MCGIIGEIRWDGRPIDINNILKGQDNLSRRGPDGGGIVQFDGMVFGHRRLKIFDLSEKSQQPMIDSSLGLGIVFNGAIYNYKELRLELEAKGYHFFSEGDTEVLLKAYHAWGPQMLQKLNGMFSLAIWERDSKKLMLARDRFGIKPLFYSQNSQFLRFSSTPQSLLGSDINTDLNPIALQYYLMFHAIPEPITLFQGIKKLEPGSAMIFYPNGKSENFSYWKLNFSSEKYIDSNERSEEYWIEELKSTLIKSIKRRLLADVPTGILLSGGLDSSLLVALIANFTSSKLKTFSIGFESTLQETGNEFTYSDAVAQKFQTDHNKISINNPNMLDSLQDCIRAMSEPMPSHDNIGFYLLSKEVVKHVKVALSGQGADELFAGYSWFQNLPIGNISPQLASSKLMNLVADRTYNEYLEVLTPKYQAKNFSNSLIEEMCLANNSSNMLDYLQQYESTFPLTNGPLARVDNMTMAWGLEARVPFLDHEVAELACKIPIELKIRDGGKYILKKMARGLLPDNIIDRQKGYFPVPALKYFSKKELDWMKDILSTEKIIQRGIFNPIYIEKLFNNSNEQYSPNGGSKLWQIFILEYWLQLSGL